MAPHHGMLAVHLEDAEAGPGLLSGFREVERDVAVIAQPGAALGISELARFTAP